MLGLLQEGLCEEFVASVLLWQGRVVWCKEWGKKSEIATWWAWEMMAPSDRPYELPVTLFTSLIFIIIIIIIINNMFIPRTPTPGSRLCFIFCVVGAAKRFILESAAVKKIIYIQTYTYKPVVTVLYSVHTVE